MGLRGLLPGVVGGGGDPELGRKCGKGSGGYVCRSSD